MPQQVWPVSSTKGVDLSVNTPMPADGLNGHSDSELTSTRFLN